MTDRFHTTGERNQVLADCRRVDSHAGPGSGPDRIIYYDHEGRGPEHYPFLARHMAGRELELLSEGRTATNTAVYHYRLGDRVERTAADREMERAERQPSISGRTR